MEHNDLTLLERFAWDSCRREHGFEQTKDRTCSDCSHMIRRLERLLIAILVKEMKTK
jgi:hypothetical protein